MVFRLVHGDAVQEMARLSDESVHLALFSPPYDNQRTYSGVCSFEYEALGKELERVLVPDGVAVVLIQDASDHGVKTGTSFRMVVNWMDNGLNLFQTALYTRQRAPGSHWNTRFREDHDFIHIFVKGRSPRHFDKTHMKVRAKHAGELSKASYESSVKDRSANVQHEFTIAEFVCQGTVQRYTDVNLTARQGHPAVMSDKFAKDYILCFTEPGDTVLDPYVGSGTTVVQAITYGRNAIGFDISAKYLNLARDRVAKECIQPRVM